MINSATKRAILRWIHLILAIPVIGYVYSPFAELPNYAPVARFVSIPVLILSGFWMYAGVIFAIIAVALTGRIIHRAENLADGSCATVEGIGKRQLIARR